METFKMRRLQIIGAIGAFIGLILIAGCGGSSSSSGTTITYTDTIQDLSQYVPADDASAVSQYKNVQGTATLTYNVANGASTSTIKDGSTTLASLTGSISLTTLSGTYTGTGTYGTTTYTGGGTVTDNSGTLALTGWWYPNGATSGTKETWSGTASLTKS
jgi:hypothetical protein